MTVASTFAVSVIGVSGQVVEIEADLSAGLPGLFFTGLADVSVVESRDRIRSAVTNSGIEWPNRRITLAMLPADVRKIGSRFDLGLAVGVLAAAGVVPSAAIARWVWLGELGLDGKLRPVRGVLPAVIAARDAGLRQVVVPSANGAEAALVDGVDVRSAEGLGQVVGWLTGQAPALPRALPGDLADHPAELDLSDVAGQPTAKRALEVAAAGGHHLLLQGAPGAGKTMLAQRLPGLLPALDDDAALEATAVHSVAGTLVPGTGLIRRPPWQAPHHTASVTALVGGGSGLARPGAISLAHRGVLFIDEAPELSPRAIDALRQPLESGHVVLHRALGPVTYPARFQLVLAANPCPCGSAGRTCICAPNARRRYGQRLSGPVLDRVDVHVQVDPVSHAELLAVDSAEPSTAVAARVAAARRAAEARWAGRGWQLNAQVPGVELRDLRRRLSRTALADAEAHVERGLLSARGFDRVLRLAWSVADLNGRTSPAAADVAEALFFRTGRTGQP